MTLRTRLVLGLGIAFAVFATAAALTIVSQRRQLYDQVDAQLMATPLPPQRGDQRGAGQQGGEVPVDNATPNDDEAPISELFMAQVNPQGELIVIISGQLLRDTPDVDFLLDSPPTRNRIETVSGVDGVSQFRALYLPGNAGGASILAVPVDDVEDTLDRLTYTLLGVTALTGLILLLVGSWVTRFGLRPITQMTNTADAIARGDRSRRASEYDESTEAGRLAQAFNVMLDQRDRDDERLRMFVSDASHELRTPLTSIRGYLDLYAQGAFPEKPQVDDAVRRMQTESARMQLLVEDLLVLAKLDEHQGLQLARIDLGSLLADVAASATASHPDRHIDVAATAGLQAEADPLRLQQAVAGLVDNAITHTPPTTAITVTASDEHGMTHILVSDDGPGIAPNELDRIFDRFYRGDPSRARTSGGSGLGLAITKAIIEAHGGTISVESTFGAGACFTIALPAAADETPVPSH